MKPSSDRFEDLPERIRRALMNEWDPIGVRDTPGAEHEYDGYVSTICRMLTQGNDQQEMLAYLWWVETEYMGLSGNRQATELFAGRLFELLRDGWVIGDYVMDELYARMELLLKELIYQSGDYLKVNEKLEVESMVTHREYFLALQNFCFGVVKENRSLSARATEIVFELMKLMGVDDEKDDDFWLCEEFTTAIAGQNQMNSKDVELAEE